MRSGKPRRRGLVAVLVAVLVALVVVLVAAGGLDATSAAFSAATSNPANTLAADRLAPPGPLTVSARCGAAAPIASHGARTAVGTDTLTLPVPERTVGGDVLVVQVAYTGTSADLSAPVGWSRELFNTNAPTLASAVYVKVAGAPEPDPTFAFPAGTGARLTGGIAAYSGVSATDPVDAHNGFIASGTSARPPEVTTTSAGTMVLYLVTVVGAAFDAPAETTRRWRLDNGPSAGVTAADEQFAGPGTIVRRVFTSPNGSSTSAPYAAQTVALRRGTAAPSALVSWAPTPSAWADGYRLERQEGTAPPVGWALPEGTTSYTDAPLVSGTTYTYRLSATGRTWTSSPRTGTVVTPSC